jgi:hypothetical protein
MPKDQNVILYMISGTYLILSGELRFRNWEVKVTYWKEITTLPGVVLKRDSIRNSKSPRRRLSPTLCRFAACRYLSAASCISPCSMPHALPVLSLSKDALCSCILNPNYLFSDILILTRSQEVIKKG